ncbi:MAG: hypothetical protein RET84_02540 [Pseudomonadota bacterium]|nr:hypothetical protein [Pseudomonadota bacterium]
MTPGETERALKILTEHAWDREVTWGQIRQWSENFGGGHTAAAEENKIALIALTRFLYFGKRLVREMLRSIYRDHFESPLIQAIRRHLRHSKDAGLIRAIFHQERNATRFIGMGNPSESGAHLLYYFRQINRLPKDMFVDMGTAFVETMPGKTLSFLKATNPSVRRYVFFDDLVGSGQQSRDYLSKNLQRIRRRYPSIELRFMCLFATSKGIEGLNAPEFFDGKAMCLFELDDTYKAFHPSQRYFPDALSPNFDAGVFRAMAIHYGSQLVPDHPLGYKDGQLMLGFTHNTPDNTLPIFWNEGRTAPWEPIFVRYGKVY